MQTIKKNLGQTIFVILLITIITLVTINELTNTIKF
jgi:hypothetical protein